MKLSLRAVLTIGIVFWLCFTLEACHKSPIVLIPAQVDIYGFIDAGVVTWAKPWSATLTPEHAIIISEGLLLEYHRLVKENRELRDKIK